MFVTASQAALSLGGYEYCAHIGKCLSGKRSYAYGYRWEMRPITDEYFSRLVRQSNLTENIKVLV